MDKNINSLSNGLSFDSLSFDSPLFNFSSFNITFILLFLLFVVSLIYIRVSHCSCGNYTSKCVCNKVCNKTKFDIYENLSGSVGSESEIALTPFQSQIPKEIPRPQIPIDPTPQQPIKRYQPPPFRIPERTTSETSSPSPTLTPSQTPEGPTTIQTSDSRSQKTALQTPKFDWSSDPKANEALRQQVMKNIEITRQKDINIIQTKPGTIQNLKITPESEYVDVQPPTESQPIQPIQPIQPPKKSNTNWILLAVSGGIWCLFVIIFMIVLVIKYR